ncbi:hypothetical protein QBC34DRAFT_441414 [Podospora aff. communis PSN243]|uniref:Cyanovirin-N domain-containing protein n=1 Tax=Podospora aff. communis PSN243 TaxID=3040156 RepID=A0AAV9GCC0_9PEZI|nr:hypothetical protein QBC34DRAFT_441414 [Podospora aff. communis PSN243]
MFSNGIRLISGLAVLASGITASPLSSRTITSMATASSATASLVTHIPGNYTRIPDPIASSVTSSLSSAIATPTAQVNASMNAPLDNLFCGNFNTADTSDVEKINAGFGDDMCTTPAKTCTRHGCLNTSGVYVCNDNAFAITQKCSNIGLFGKQIALNCCLGAGATSGQYFSDAEHFNVVVAYGNCDHEKDEDRPSLGPGDDKWGPNGPCVNVALAES